MNPEEINEIELHCESWQTGKDTSEENLEFLQQLKNPEKIPLLRALYEADNRKNSLYFNVATTISEIIDESHKDDERPEDEENEIILVPENFIEILPLTIGIRSKDGLMSRVISKSTKLPAHKEVTITTTNDNQEIGAVKVYQGERDFVKNNIFIGKFDVPLPPKPKGEVKFIVDVYVDKQLNIKCTAKVLCSDLPETTHVMKSKLFRLDDEEVERLKEQAKIWRKEDNLKIDALHAKNDLLEQLDKYKKAARKAKLKDAENQVKKEIQAVLSMNTPNKDIEAYIESLKNIRADLEKKFGYLLR